MNLTTSRFMEYSQHFCLLGGDATANELTDEPVLPPNDLQLSIPSRTSQSYIAAWSSHNIQIATEIHELPLIVREKVQEHVFNKMPIRMLAFDSNGGQLQLLERSAIANLVLSQIRDEYPNGVPVDMVEFTVQQFSQYAILSHTWIRGIPGDVVYGDWTTRELPIHAKGYQKVTQFCQVAAREHRVLLGWMDTVCINKESSTELDESIRSMYKWYKGAHVCVIYLAETSVIDEIHRDSWFTRGWTLQELLASRNSKFYNREWHLLVPQNSISAPAFDDPKFDSSWKEIKLDRQADDTGLCNIPLELQYQVFKATTITRLELERFYEFIPLSRTMQLAAHRQVTREEDSVYSLMGLLGVGIPIAYGEGSASALQRLIREIIVSKEKFNDLFNHNGQRIIPIDIQDYTNRSTVFDHPIYSSLLDFISYPEPILLTHLGVRLTVLAVPAFQGNIYEHLIPLESKSRIFRLPPPITWSRSWKDPQDYILLDDSDSSANWTTNFLTSASNDDSDFITLSYEYPKVIFIAIITSVVDPEDGTYMLLANNALCIALSSNYTNGKKLTEIKPKIQLSGPITIPLPYSPASVGDNTVCISREKADRLGFKTVTRYFT